MTKTLVVAMLVIGAAWWVLAFGAAEPATKPATLPASRPSTAPAKELTLDLGNKVTMNLVLIPAGKFMMGSPATEQKAGKDAAEKAGVKGLDLSDEGPQHEVTLSKSFYMGIYHVTKGQFAAFVADTNYKTEAEKDGKAWGWDGTKCGEMAGYSWRKTGFPQDDDHPVVNVSWSDAVAFCDWLGKKTRKTVTLPTEGQFEYAARAGAKTAYQWGDDPDDGKGWCNAADQTLKKQFPNWPVFKWDDGYVFTSPVGKFKANAFGLYDMTGNAWEWCSDWYDKDYYATSTKTDPQGPTTGTERVLLGGSWSTNPGNCRCACRLWSGPVVRCVDFGFRVVVADD